jgi:hypothetical protein
MLSFAFFVVVAPVGLALRLLKGDPLNQKFDSGALTYWLEPRGKVARDPDMRSQW